MRILIFILFPFTIFAQEKFKVEYERRNFIKLEGNSEQHRLMEQQFSKPVYIELLGNLNECSSKEIERISNEQGPKTTMMILGMEKDVEKYLNFTDNLSLVSKELENNLFLISSQIPKYDWKLSRESKKIQGYDVKKAIYEDDTFTYEAWYSTDIKSKCGPSEAIGLPGLVLELTRIHIKKPDNYTTFKLNNLLIDNNLEFKKPTKGKAYSEEQFIKFRAEYDKKLKESISNGVDRN